MAFWWLVYNWCGDWFWKWGGLGNGVVKLVILCRFYDCELVLWENNVTGFDAFFLVKLLCCVFVWNDAGLCWWILVFEIRYAMMYFAMNFWPLSMFICRFIYSDRFRLGFLKESNKTGLDRDQGETKCVLVLDLEWIRLEWRNASGIGIASVTDWILDMDHFGFYQTIVI